MEILRCCRFFLMDLLDLQMSLVCSLAVKSLHTFLAVRNLFSFMKGIRVNERGEEQQQMVAALRVSWVLIERAFRMFLYSALRLISWLSSYATIILKQRVGGLYMDVDGIFSC